jgi:hypothetical protein
MLAVRNICPEENHYGGAIISEIYSLSICNFNVMKIQRVFGSFNIFALQIG